MGDANEAISHIRRGCQLAKKLQESLPYLENEPPHILSSSCEEISSTFRKAIDLLNSSSPSPFEGPRMFFQGEPSQSHDMPSGFSQGLDFFPHHALSRTSQFDASRMAALDVVPGLTETAKMMGFVGGSGSGGGGDSDCFLRPGASGEFRVGNVGDAGTSTQVGPLPAGRTSRSRKEAGEKRVVRVPAPREGNLEIPPEDGFTWRKYGQKEILHSRYPRGYFRCTHRNFYNCQAKKQVQRLDDDPYTFEVTYRGHHTCQTSTAPFLIPTSQTQQTMLITAQESSVSTSIALSSWFSSALGGGERPEPHVEPQLQPPYRGNPGMGESSNVFGEASSHTGGGKEREGSPVEEYAKFMFSSGSSSDNIDAIFSAKKEE